MIYHFAENMKVEFRETKDQQKCEKQKTSDVTSFQIQTQLLSSGISSLACVAFNASVIAHKIRRDPLLRTLFSEQRI